MVLFNVERNEFFCLGKTVQISRNKVNTSDAFTNEYLKLKNDLLELILDKFKKIGEDYVKTYNKPFLGLYVPQFEIAYMNKQVCSTIVPSNIQEGDIQFIFNPDDNEGQVSNYCGTNQLDFLELIFILDCLNESNSIVPHYV